MLIGAHALAGRGSPGLHLLLAPALFLLGSALGGALGTTFSCLCSRRGRGDTLRRVGFGAGTALVLLPLSWLVSAAIAVGVALQAEVRLSWIAVSVGGTVVGLAVGAWACLEGCAMARHALQRTRRTHAAESGGAEERHPGGMP